jgi:glycosyltransferase involved in cell wall biosynthesis
LLLWAGRITPEKGLHLAVETALVLGKRLWIMGYPQDQSYLAEILNRAAEGRTNQIVYLGLCSHREMAVLSSLASLGLMTSTWPEAFGLVTAQFLACGLPVVGLDRGALKEIVLDQQNGIVVDAPAEANDDELIAGLCDGVKVCESMNFDSSCVRETITSRYSQEVFGAAVFHWLKGT